METTLSSLPPNSKLLISRFTRQVYIDSHAAIQSQADELATPQLSKADIYTNTAIISPSINKQIFSVNLTAGGTVYISKPTNGCTEFTLLMKNPLAVTVNAFPSGAILPLMTPAQVIHSIRFLWDSNLKLWRSVRTA